MGTKKSVNPGFSLEPKLIFHLQVNVAELTIVSRRTLSFNGSGLLGALLNESTTFRIVQHLRLSRACIDYFSESKHLQDKPRQQRQLL